VPPKADERIERGDFLLAAPACDTAKAFELHRRV
jgi:hypothetical protein